MRSSSPKRVMLCGGFDRHNGSAYLVLSISTGRQHLGWREGGILDEHAHTGGPRSGKALFARPGKVSSLVTPVAALFSTGLCAEHFVLW